jgi:hypothetical protein
MLAAKKEIEIADDLQKASHQCEYNIEFNYSHIILPGKGVYIQITRFHIGSYILVHLHDLRCIQLLENAASSFHLA